MHWVRAMEPLHRQPEATQQQPLEPGEGPLGWLVLLIAVFTVAIIVAARRKTRRTGEEQGLRSMPGGGAVGNALFDLGSVLQPDRPDAAVIQMLEEEDERDDLGDRRDPPPFP
jgi:hypothetical protein